MSRALRVLSVFLLGSPREGAAGKRVEVDRNPGQHPHHAGPIEGHVRRCLLTGRAKMHDDVSLLFQLREPPDVPAEDLGLVGKEVPGRGQGGRCSPHWRPCGGDEGIRKLAEPHGDGSRCLGLQQLTDPRRTHARGPRDLPERQPGLLGRHDRPAPFALGVGHPCHSETEGVFSCHSALRSSPVRPHRCPEGVEKVIRTRGRLRTHYPRRQALQKAMAYFRAHRCRMLYAAPWARNVPIGSGVVEAASKTLVSQRLKRLGMRWHTAGGQAISTFRVLYQRARFVRAWPLLVETYKPSVTLPRNVLVFNKRGQTIHSQYESYTHVK